MPTFQTAPLPSLKSGTSAPAPHPGRHELNLHLAQAEILDRELECRKKVVAETERMVTTLEEVFLLLQKKNPVFAAGAKQLQAVRGQIEEMRANERTAALPPNLPLPDDAEPNIDLLRQNALRATANHAYFRALPIHHVLLGKLHPLLLKLSQSDRTLTAPLTEALQAMRESLRRLQPLDGALSVRRVVKGVGEPSPENVLRARRMWQTVLEQNPAHPYLQTLQPHESRPGKLRVAFVAIGGLGDALLQTPCVAEIRRRLGDCEIVFIHSRGVVHPLLARNRTVEATIFAEDPTIGLVPDLLKIAGIFDVVFESRFVIWGEICHQSRLTAEADVRWIQSTQAQLDTFAPYLERFPLYSNLFARLVAPRMLLDIHGLSTGLPVSVDSPLLFCPDETDAAFPEQNGLVDGGYVTVHDGFDEGFGKAMGLSRCTKQLPIGKWQAIIASLRREGWRVVQVGAANEPPLPGVDLDLRGKTSLSQLGFVLKGAAVHLDTEGGIVHVARAVHKRSIVFFGPTSVTFWGYPQNVNLCSEEYADHWWINSDWMARSPVPQKRSAMEAFDVSAIPALVRRERDRARRHYRVTAGSLPHSQRTENEARMAVIGSCPDDRLERLGAATTSVEIFDVASDSPRSQAVAAGRTVHLASLYNLPANSERYDRVVCWLALDATAHKRRALGELLRLLKPGGVLIWTFTERNESAAPGVSLAEATDLLREFCGDAATLLATDSSPAEVRTVAITRVAEIQS